MKEYNRLWDTNEGENTNDGVKSRLWDTNEGLDSLLHFDTLQGRVKILFRMTSKTILFLQNDFNRYTYPFICRTF